MYYTSFYNNEVELTISILGEGAVLSDLLKITSNFLILQVDVPLALN